MRTKFFSTVFLAILLTAIACISMDAALSPVNEGLNISGSASTLQHAPTGNILKKFKKEGGKWVFDRIIDAEWFCRVTMSATVYGNGNVSVAAVGDAVHRADGSHFRQLSPDVTNDRVSRYWVLSAKKTVSARAAETIKTKDENDVGEYKLTGTGYYKQSTGGGGFSASKGIGGSVTISGITSDTLTRTLEENIPTFDIDIQCDPAEACNDAPGGSGSQPPSGSTPPSSGSTPPTGSGSTPPTPTDNTPNCQD
ncbi:MAG: hypothetical protein OXU51_16785, partial [Candidatus Poribacteria bacterium]|nr:hypothetical protein [Candidatus Poribacteria bacterium]